LASPRGDLLHAERNGAQARAAKLIEAPGGGFLAARRPSSMPGGPGSVLPGAKTGANAAVIKKYANRRLYSTWPFDRAMKMFSPFAFTPQAQAPAATPAPSAAKEPAADDSLTELKKRMEEMQAQIERLANKT
jgi:hypothetical protein